MPVMLHLILPDLNQSNHCSVASLSAYSVFLDKAGGTNSRFYRYWSSHHQPLSQLQHKAAPFASWHPARNSSGSAASIRTVAGA